VTGTSLSQARERPEAVTSRRPQASRRRRRRAPRAARRGSRRVEGRSTSSRSQPPRTCSASARRGEQLQRLHEQRLARAGLAGQCSEPGRQLEADRLDDAQVPHLELADHGAGMLAVGRSRVNELAGHRDRQRARVDPARHRGDDLRTGRRQDLVGSSSSSAIGRPWRASRASSGQRCPASPGRPVGAGHRRALIVELGLFRTLDDQPGDLLAAQASARSRLAGATEKVVAHGPSSSEAPKKREITP